MITSLSMHRMLRFGATLFLLGSLAMPLSASEVALEKRLLLGGKVEMLVPTTFQPMPEEILKLKYPSERRPTFVLSNERASVSLALNHTQNRVPQAELADARASAIPSAWRPSQRCTSSPRRFSAPGRCRCWSSRTPTPSRKAMPRRSWPWAVER